MKSMAVVLLVFILQIRTEAQGFYERMPGPVANQAVFIFGYDMQSNVFRIVSSATGAAYLAPITLNEEKGIPTIVTARHVLYHKIDSAQIFDSTNLLSGLLVKFYVSSTNGEAFFMRIPLRQDSQSNFWVSEVGRDLAVIPIPNKKLRKLDNITFKEYQILTPERARERAIIPGLLVATVCLQPEYFNFPQDFFVPENYPIIRVGHLSRLGWCVLPNGSVFARDHVIDIHTSPGNSGATAIIWAVIKERESNLPMFLGVVSCFIEERSAYRTYDAPIKRITSDKIQLVNASNNETNTFALSTLTPSNPDLTSIVPVDELVGLASRPAFVAAANTMNKMIDEYESLSPTKAAALIMNQTSQKNLAPNKLSDSTGDPHGSSPASQPQH